MKGLSTAPTPKAYIDSLVEPRKGEIKKLDALIRKTVPSLKPNMNFGMLGYGKYHYVYASGRQGDWSLISLASQKNYISLYVSCTDAGKYIAELYKKELPKANIGKSCIRFKRLEDVDLIVIQKILKHTVKAAKSQGLTA